MNEKLKNFAVQRYYKIAKALADNPEGLSFKIEKLREKLSKKAIKDALGSYTNDFLALFRLLKAWSKHEYMDVSKSTIVSVILCLIYFLTPTDFVPDFIIGLGLLDDITVLKWTLDKLGDDIDRFKEWESQNE